MDLEPAASIVEKGMRFWPAQSLAEGRRPAASSLMAANVVSRLRCRVWDLSLPASRLQNTKSVEHSPLAEKGIGLQGLAQLAEVEMFAGPRFKPCRCRHLGVFFYFLSSVFLIFFHPILDGALRHTVVCTND